MITKYIGMMPEAKFSSDKFMTMTVSDSYKDSKVEEKTNWYNLVAYKDKVALAKEYVGREVEMLLSPTVNFYTPKDMEEYMKKNPYAKMVKYIDKNLDWVEGVVVIQYVINHVAPVTPRKDSKQELGYQENKPF